MGHQDGIAGLGELLDALHQGLALTGAEFLMFQYVISTAPYQGLLLGALL
jgi:hypothetical protein